MQLKDYIKQNKSVVDKALMDLLPDENSCHHILAVAMEYSVKAGGKRVRPLMVMSAAEACGGDPGKAIPAGCALEMIHTYSLIHDDLPALDNDDLRRGKPTCHKVFGEDNAILAGDGLLTFAFQVLSEQYENALAGRLVYELSKAAGPLGMVGGQSADVEGEKTEEMSEEKLHYIHERKTGALLTVAVRMGAICAGATDEQLEALTEYGKQLGLAFQISDDILDVVGDQEKMGKTLGKDDEQNKLTFPKIYGLEKSKEMAKETSEKAVAALEMFGDKADILKQLAVYVVERDN